MTNDKKIEFLKKLGGLLDEYGVEIEVVETCIGYLSYKHTIDINIREDVIEFNAYIFSDDIKSKIKELEGE